MISKAHPRAGGENEHADYDTRLRKGSSPRGRGKLALGYNGGVGSRLIPARAGKTTYTVALSCAHTAHPRAGGENPVASRDAGG